jgi:hypothetical protein
MKKQNGERNLEDMSDAELNSLSDFCERQFVEAEMAIRFCQLQIAMAEEELEFRKSGKTKRSPEEWKREWTHGVSHIAQEHGLDLSAAWQLANQVVAKHEPKVRSDD